MNSIQRWCGIAICLFAGVTSETIGAPVSALNGPNGTFAVSSVDLAESAGFVQTTGTAMFGSSLDFLHDGSVYNGNPPENSGPSFAPSNGSVVVVNFDLLAKPEGYDIDSVVTLTGNGAFQNRTAQAFTLAYATVSAPASFQSITLTPAVDPFLPNNINSNSWEVQTIISGLGLENVAALQFTFANNGGDGEALYREIDVYAATVPEPASGGLAAVVVGLIFWHLRGRVPRPGGLRRLSLAVLAGSILAATNSAFAGPIITNLDTGSPNQGSFVGTDVNRAVGFTIGDGVSFSLQSVVLVLSLSEAGSSGFNLTLFSGSELQPLTPVANLTSAEPFTTAIQSHTFTPASPVTLMGNTTYWLVLKGTLPFDTTKSVWWEAPGSGYTLAGGVTFAREVFSANGGATWAEDAGPVHFAMQVNAVPEPGVAALLVAGSGLVLLARRARGR